MRTFDTVLESLESLFSDDRNFETFGYHAANLQWKKVICGFSKKWEFLHIPYVYRSSRWYPRGTQHLKIEKYDV